MEPPAQARPVLTGGATPALIEQAEPEPVGTLGRLRRVWIALLGHDTIESDADFFDLGGNSLTAVELTSRIRAEFGVRIGIDAVFDYPTLDGLAEQLDQRTS
jgi:phthiocerol/phenolphthiocerol synthesis type-I polyketide synthase E